MQLAVDEKRGKSQLMLLFEEITKEELAKQHRKEHKKQKRKKKKEKKQEERENSCEVSVLKQPLVSKLESKFTYLNKYFSYNVTGLKGLNN